MYQPVSFFIGLRYIYGCTENKFSHFTYWLSTIGIMLGVMALITVLSVMNGFERELENSILRFIPQVVILSKKGSLNPQQLPKSSIKLNGVNQITPLTVGNVILQNSKSMAIGMMIGIDPMQEDPLTLHLINSKKNDLKSGAYNIILGKRLADQMNVNYGEYVRLIITSSARFTPIGRMLNERLFNVIGTFITDSEADSYQVIVNIKDASRLMRYPSENITGWRLWLKEPLKVDKLLQQKIPNNVKWQDWRECKGELFQAVRMEKNIMTLLLSLIIFVAAFNIIISVGLMVMEKRSEIAILKTQGMTSFQIMLMFIIQGASSGVIGALFGTILGVLLTTQFNGNLSSIINIFINGTILPIEIRPLQIVNIILITIAIAIFSTFYPSWYAATSKPAEALRYE